jgi:sRNA-binding protein
MLRVLLSLCLPCLLLADFRYDQTTRVTKGMLLKMPFGKKPEPTTTTHFMKGGRMATSSKDSTTIIDFDRQVFTTLMHEKKQYWQMTFAEMQQMMQDVQAEMNKAGRSNSGSASMEMKFEAKATGAEKDVNGYVAKQVMMTVEMVAKDGKTNQSGSMRIVSDSWHSENIPGYAEYKAQMAKIAGKVSWIRGNPFAGAMQQPGMAEGMKKMAEEMAKVPGLPVLTISRMGMAGGPNVDMSQMEGVNAPSQAEVGDAVKRAGGEAAGGAAGRAVGGRLGGMIGSGLGGRLGGFGRKKTDEAAEQAKQAEEQAKAQAQEKVKAAEEKSADGMMLMMETVTDTSNFSTAAISEDVFSIPAGYAKVENDWAKRRKN